MQLQPLLTIGYDCFLLPKEANVPAVLKALTEGIKVERNYENSAGTSNRVRYTSTGEHPEIEIRFVCSDQIVERQAEP